MIRLLWVAAVVAVVVYIPTKTTSGTVGDFTLAFEYAIAAMSLNLVLGYTGIISIGHSAFFGIGMYTTAILVTRYGWSQGWTFYVAAAIAFVIGCLVALPGAAVEGHLPRRGHAGPGRAVPDARQVGQARVAHRGSGRHRRRHLRRHPDWPIIGELRGREGRAVFIYWLAVLLLVISYLVARGVVKSRVGRSLIADPRQRDGGGRDGRPTGQDEDAGVRHLGGDVRDRRLAVDDPAATWPARTSATSRSSAASRSC